MGGGKEDKESDAPRDDDGTEDGASVVGTGIDDAGNGDGGEYCTGTNVSRQYALGAGFVCDDFVLVHAVGRQRQSTPQQQAWPPGRVDLRPWIPAFLRMSVGRLAGEPRCLAVFSYGIGQCSAGSEL